MDEKILQTLKINKLSQAQFDRASQKGELDEYALYLTLDEGNNTITLFGYLTKNNGNLIASIENINYFQLNQILQDKNIPRLLLMKENNEVIEAKFYGYKNNLITFMSALTEGMLFINMDNENNISTIIEPFYHAEEDCVDETSENSNLLITEGAVWKSLNNFHTLYIIYCNIVEQNGAYISVSLANNGKSLETIIAEAAKAYQQSRGVLLADTSKGIYLYGLMAVENMVNSSYKFIFDASQNSLGIKNIIHLDSTGFTCYHMEIQPKLVIEKEVIRDSSNPISSEAVFSALSEAKEEVLNVANGKCKTETFDNKATLEQWIKGLSEEELKKMHIGDVFLLRSVGEPDYWWEPEQNGVPLTTYTQDDIVVSGKGAARILETTKVDINRIESTYAHKQRDLDSVKLKRAYKYSSSASRQNGDVEYDTENKRICTWSNGAREAWQDPDENTLYLIIEE